MGREHRKSLRRVVCLPAAMLNGDESILGICTMLDVSAGGAKIKLRAATEVPNEFILLLSKNGKVRRRCRVSRRTETEIAVQFVVGSSKDST